MYPNDIFWVNKIKKKNFQGNQLSLSDSRPKYTNLTEKFSRGAPTPLVTGLMRIRNGNKTSGWNTLPF